MCTISINTKHQIPVPVFRISTQMGVVGFIAEPGVFMRVKTLLFSVQSEVTASETLQCPLVLHCLSAENHKNFSHTSTLCGNSSVTYCMQL